MIVCRFCLFLLSYRMGGGLHADCRGRSCFLSRIIESFSREELLVTRRITDVCHEFLFYHELSNFRIVSSHGESRSSRIFFVPNYRIVELILSITRRIAEGHGFYHELSNYRINTFNHTESRGRSRIIELSNFLHTENRGRSRIFITRLVLWTH